MGGCRMAAGFAGAQSRQPAARCHRHPHTAAAAAAAAHCPASGGPVGCAGPARWTWAKGWGMRAAMDLKQHLRGMPDFPTPGILLDRKHVVSGKRGSVRVDLGGVRINKKK